MPRDEGTRKKRAAKLLERLQRGPMWDRNSGYQTPEDYAAAYRRWADTWILQDVTDLIPELRQLSK